MVIISRAAGPGNRRDGKIRRRWKPGRWRNGNHYVAPKPWLRTGPGLALDGKPKFDLDQHNPAYIERIPHPLPKAQNAGVFISVMLFEGYGVQFQKDAWPNHPINAANNINGVDGDKNGDGKGIEPGSPQLAEKALRAFRKHTCAALSKR